MDLIKNFNQTLKDLREKSRKDITGLLPQEIKIYDSHILEKLQVIRANSIDAVHFEHQFKQSLSAVFGLTGEIEGFAVCQNNSHINQEIFIEAMNILVGNYLTNLDEKEQILATLLAPIIFQQEAQNTKLQDEHFYKFSHRLRIFMQEAQTFHANYNLYGENEAHPITITFILKFKGPEYDWQRI